MSELDLLPQELRLAEKIAKQAASKWSAVDSEDAVGHLYLWLVENHKTVVRYREEQGGQGKLVVALRRAIHKYCVKEQTIANGGTLNDAAFYTREQVERILPFIWEYDAWTQTTIRETTNHNYTRGLNASPGAFDNALAMLADVAGAFYGIDKRDQELLTYRFRDHQTFPEMAEYLDVSEDGARKAVDRAIDRLHSSLGGLSPVWSSADEKYFKRNT